MFSSMRRVAAGILAFGCSSSACAGTGPFVWFQQLPEQTTQAGREYVVGVGDMLTIRVLGHEEMSLHGRVRVDGRLSLLLIGDVEAKGKRPSALRAELEGRLKDYIVSPSVVVNVDEVAPTTIIALGEVARPGAYPLENDPRLAHALALVGGLTDYASRNSIYVVRSGSRPTRIRFTYESIYRNVGGAGDFLLRSGDVLEVE
jgi:polysaccharide export outer membrane protein